MGTMCIGTFWGTGLLVLTKADFSSFTIMIYVLFFLDKKYRILLIKGENYSKAAVIRGKAYLVSGPVLWTSS